MTALEHAWGGQVDWTLLGGQASLGLLLGYAVGYTTKKALKVGLILVALLLVMGIALEELGFLVINWGVLEETYRGSVEQMGGWAGCCASGRSASRPTSRWAPASVSAFSSACGTVDPHRIAWPSPSVSPSTTSRITGSSTWADRFASLNRTWWRHASS